MFSVVGQFHGVHGRQTLVMSTKLSNGRSHEYRAETLRTIAYWESQKNEFPMLSQCARRILNVPASSCQIEQKFSRISHQFSEHRQSLKAATITQLVQTTTSENFLKLLKCGSGSQETLGDSTNSPDTQVSPISSQSLFE